MNIRLDPKDLDFIIKAFKECLPERGHLWFFGSRADNTKQGGDIDLYVEVENYNVQRAFEVRNCWNVMQDLLGEQKIHILVRDPGQDLSIYQIAQQEGIKII